MSEYPILPARRNDPYRVDPRVGTRVEAFVRDVDLGPVAAILAASRDDILRRWLEAARVQSFHAEHPDGAVTDHVPHLFDALLAFLQRWAPRSVDPEAPLDDRAVHEAARAHARARFEQGMEAAEVLTEFRLLRQEIGRALRQHVDDAGESDIVGAELLVHDTLDGAATLGLAALEAHESDRRRLAADVVRLGAEKDEALAQLDAIFAGAPVGLGFWDRELRYVRVNRALAALAGRPPDALVGHTVAEVMPGAWPMLESAWRRVLDAGEPQLDLALDSEKIGAGGATRHWLCSFYPVRRSGGQIFGIGGVAVDVTAHREAESEREALLDAMVHDLRNPLTSIKGMADLLRRYAASGRLDPDRSASRLEAISETAARMAAQLDEVVDLARLRAGQPLELVRQPTDLVALARRVADQLADSAEDIGIRVETTVPELIGEWDALRLERVLSNLLSNAVKYSPTIGDVTVRIDSEELPDGGWAVLSVTDRGIGIPADDLLLIFERFHRGRNVIGRTPGEGLGLAGARQIVEQHGGTITVASVEGRGATFTVRLPRAHGGTQ